MLIQFEGAGWVKTAVLVDVVMVVVVEPVSSVIVIDLASKTVVVVLKVPVAVEAVTTVVVNVCIVSVAVTAGGATVEPGVDTDRTTTFCGNRVLERV